MRRRVVVTGMGLITPHGDDLDSVFQRIYAGESAITRIRSGVGAMEGDVLVGKASWPTDELTGVQRVAMDPVAQMGFLAAKRALAHAGLDDAPELLAPAGVYMGCGIGGTETYEGGYATYFNSRRRRMKPSVVPRVMPSATAAHISMGYGIRGPSQTYSVACASSAVAIGEAYRAIRDGYLDRVVAGGAEAMLSGATLVAWEAMGVLAKQHPGGPERSVRPFDKARTGFALAEGAGVLILESEEAARARGATIRGEIIGYGASSDAHNLTQPSEDGQVQCMVAALADARLQPDAVGYINAHATGTQVGDRVELLAIQRTFEAHVDTLAVSSTKSMHGHLVGAAGAVELGVTLLALAQERIPPTANLTDPDDECRLDCVPVQGRETPGLTVAMSNSFAFGGSNVSLLVRRRLD